MLLERAGTPYPADLVVLAEAHALARLGAEPRSTLAGLPDPGMAEARVLGADPEAMAVVARRSIDAGDRGERGSRLAALPYGHGDTFRSLGELRPYVLRADRPGIADEVLPHSQALGTARARTGTGSGARGGSSVGSATRAWRPSSPTTGRRPYPTPRTTPPRACLSDLVGPVGRPRMRRR